ncbi:Uncharacterized membrane protein YesL [Tenuibacillus multivorans]|uniref:Uncharacterized membrane protein YesL n=3 Tax=Tenuibacillus multivorans TaxID=237069 RepID=A0A1H0BRI1_9BACI|nr:Uncharacterized membrane protein YesL [Tenuibacillus multivorans]
MMDLIMRKMLDGCEWIMRIVKLNLICVLTSALGIVVFSFLPALVGGLYVTRGWLKGETDLPIWKRFWQGFKQYYGKSQLLGWILAIGYLILYVDYSFFNRLQGDVIGSLGLGSLVILSGIWMMLTIYIFPLMLTKNLSILRLFKVSFFSIMAYIHYLFIALIGILAILFISYLLPGMWVFLTIGTILFWVNCFYRIVEHKLSQKHVLMKI